jgi:hypothetical protein
VIGHKRLDVPQLPYGDVIIGCISEVHYTLGDRVPSLQGLIDVMRETRRLLSLPENDFAWSSWKDQQAALAEIDEHIDTLQRGSVPNMAVLFAPTGPIQEVSVSSGWGEAFLRLAERFDNESAKVT